MVQLFVAGLFTREFTKTLCSTTATITNIYLAHYKIK